VPSLDFSQAWPWLQWVLAVAAVVVFVGGAVKYVPILHGALRRFVKTVDSLEVLPDELERQAVFREETNRKLDDLMHEVFPNSGKSLRDAIDRQEATLNAVQAKLANDNTRIIELQARDPQGRFKKEE
jgi:hypothetical protein